MASDFVNHEKLLHLICDNFLPLKSAHMTNSSGLLYDQPVHYALKFLRLLMMWGRNITKKILDPEFYDLGPRILCYLSIEPDMQSNTLQESLRLIVEAGRTWITCLRYGLGKKPSLNTQSCIEGLLGVRYFCFWAVWAAGPVLKKKVGGRL